MGQGTSIEPETCPDDVQEESVQDKDRDLIPQHSMPLNEDLFRTRHDTIHSEWLQLCIPRQGPESVESSVS